MRRVFGAPLRGRDAVLRYFNLVHSPERKEQLDQIFRRVLRCLPDDVTDRSSDGRVEQHISSLQSGEIDPHCLSGWEGSHSSPRNGIVAYPITVVNLTERLRRLGHLGFALLSPGRTGNRAEGSQLGI